MFYIFLFITLLVLYAAALVIAVKAGSTTMLLVLIMVILFALMVTAFAALTIAVGNFIEYGRERRLRKYLVKNTASVKIRTVNGTITGREPKGDKLLVTVLVGSKTYFIADDEDVFFASYSDSAVRVKFREHRDASNKIIHRELIRIIL